MIDYLRLAELLLAAARLLTFSSFSFWLKISAALMPTVTEVRATCFRHQSSVAGHHSGAASGIRASITTCACIFSRMMSCVTAMFVCKEVFWHSPLT